MIVFCKGLERFGDDIDFILGREGKLELEGLRIVISLTLKDD